MPALLFRAKINGFHRQPVPLALLNCRRDDEIRTVFEPNKPAAAALTGYRIAQLFITTAKRRNPTKYASALRKAIDITTNWRKLPSVNSCQKSPGMLSARRFEMHLPRRLLAETDSVEVLPRAMSVADTVGGDHNSNRSIA